MKSLGIRGSITQTKDGYLIKPATRADATLLASYAVEAADKYMNIEFKSMRGSGSYDQKRTAWALISNIFIALNGRKPTESERNQLYEELIREYSDKRASWLHPGEETYITMSEMSKAQLTRFIQTLIQVLNEAASNSLLRPEDVINVSEIFQEFQSYVSLQETDPTDFRPNGEYLSLDEYRETHRYSYASGKACGDDGSPLEMAHIVSKGSDPMFENCCWNVMMLTHEEHVGIMHAQENHKGGWNALIARFPHIRGRIERAYNMAHHLYKIIEQEGIEI